MNIWRRAASATTLGLALTALGCARGQAATVEMVVYQTPTCGCCGAWVDHMRDNGFEVRVVTEHDLAPFRARTETPSVVTSCHFAVAGGYVIEGHVPADVVHRLLRERPDVLGLSVPGMPVGSPGMERWDGHREPYEVYTFDRSGPLAVYEHRD